LVSEEIGYIKSQIISRIINNQEILNLINKDMVDNPNDYIDTHIFKYVKVPPTIETETTYLCVEIYIPTDHTEDLTKQMIVEIHILAHCKIQNIKGLDGTRPDEISGLIEKILSKDNEIGLRKLLMISNTPNAYTTNHYGRTMRFIAEGFNRDACL